jgi:acyl-CoA synthetase (AMP-forming)/AMP-acid ligase II
MVDDSPELLTGLLGILKSGNAFVPINPVFPNDRVHFIIHDSAVNILAALFKRYPLWERDAYLLKTTFVFVPAMFNAFLEDLNGENLRRMKRRWDVKRYVSRG